MNRRLNLNCSVNVPAMTYISMSVVARLVLVLGLPLLLARLFILPSLQQVSTSHGDSDAFRLADIPISALLTRNLAAANTTRSHGLLAHALLELQNPELTPFAGPGYGVHLREVNRGAVLEAFPGGKLPRCGYGGRYDEWNKIRGLRYAYQRIVTTDPKSLSDAAGTTEESLLMGWPALLLERAGVTDPMNPLPPMSPRNAYGEAVDRIVAGLCTGKEDSLDKKRRRVTGSEEHPNEDDMQRNEMDAHMAASDEGRPVSNLPFDFSYTGPEFTFVLPPFLALYAVARQDKKWLIQAVSQLRDLVANSNAETEFEHHSDGRDVVREAKYLAHQPTPDAGLSMVMSNSTWALAGLIRVLSVLERWETGHPEVGDRNEEYDNWKHEAKGSLQRMIHPILREIKSEIADLEELRPGRLDEQDPMIFSSLVDSFAGDPLAAGSVYRLAQLGLLNDHNLLRRADIVFNTVARNIRKDGTINVFLNGKRDEEENVLDEDSNYQSIVLMMWAARRDCEKVGVCRRFIPEKWWHRMFWF